MAYRLIGLLSRGGIPAYTAVSAYKFRLSQEPAAHDFILSAQTHSDLDTWGLEAYAEATQASLACGQWIAPPHSQFADVLARRRIPAACDRCGFHTWWGDAMFLQRCSRCNAKAFADNLAQAISTIQRLEPNSIAPLLMAYELQHRRFCRFDEEDFSWWRERDQRMGYDLE